MHIQICSLRCHFNWLKSFNWQQRGECGGSFRRHSGLAWKSRQSVCHAKHLSGFVYQACSGVSTLWLLMWQLHSGFQFSGHVVLERKQEDGTQLIWLPMMYITHPRPTLQRVSQARRKGCWISVNKAWLTWRQTICEAQLKNCATCMPLNWRRSEERQAHSKTTRTKLAVLCHLCVQLCDTLLSVFLKYITMIEKLWYIHLQFMQNRKLHNNTHI